MKNLKIMNFNLNERYVFNKSIGLEVGQMIVEHHPDIISVHHVDYRTKKDLQIYLDAFEHYNILDSNRGYMTIFSKKLPLSYSHFFPLNKDIEQQLEGNKPTVSGDCLVAVFNIDHQFVSYIDAVVNSPIAFCQEKRLQRLRELIETFGSNSNYDIYKTDMQLIALNSSSSDICIPNFSDVYLLERNSEHLFIDKNFNIEKYQNIYSIKGNNGYIPIIDTNRFNERFSKIDRSIDVRNSNSQSYSPKVFYKKCIQTANLSLK